MRSRGALVVGLGAFLSSTPLSEVAVAGISGPTATGNSGAVSGKIFADKSNPSNPEPVFQGGCADLVVSLKPVGKAGGPYTVHASGDVGTNLWCGYSINVPVGTYTIESTLQNKAVALAQQATSVQKGMPSKPATFDVKRSQTTALNLRMTWPIYPTGVVIGAVDIKGLAAKNPNVNCSMVSITIVHPLKTFVEPGASMQTLPYGFCKFSDDWIPLGNVKVSVNGAPDIPSQTGTVKTGVALDLDFAYPKQ